MSSVSSSSGSPRFVLSMSDYHTDFCPLQLFYDVDPEDRYLLLGHAVISVTKVIRSAQEKIALMDHLSIEITPIEHEAFQRCTQIMREMAASVPVDAPENSSWTVPAHEFDASWMMPADAAEDSSLDCE